MRISDWSSDVCSSDLVIELHVVKAVRPTAIRNAFGLNAAEDSVELLIAYLERVMKNSVVVVIVEVERQAVVDAYRREGGHRAVIRQPEDAGEKSCRRLLVADGHDHVVEFDSHGQIGRAHV